MAEHVAKNGQDFENTVRGKNANNPQFQFLSGGEGSEYYQALLAAHHGTFDVSRGTTLSAAPSCPTTVPTGAVGLGSSTDLSELMKRWPTPEIMALSPENDRQLTEILKSLERSSSREAIAHGRAWVEARADIAPAIASNMMKRVVFLSSSLHRLHVLYLLHDIFIHEAQRLDTLRPLTSAFKPCLVWIVRPTYQIAQSVMPENEGCAKIRKLLSMWVEKHVLSSQEADEIAVLMAANDLPSPPQSGRLLQQVGVQMGMTASQMQSSHGLVGSILGALNPSATGAPIPGAMGNLGNTPEVGQVAAPAPATMATPAPCQALVPRPPGLQGALPLAIPTATENPESVPVGVMSSMLKQVSRRGKDLHAAFVPYRPLDPFYTPQALPPLPPPSTRILDRLAQFYRSVGEAAKPERSERSRSPPAELNWSMRVGRRLSALSVVACSAKLAPLGTSSKPFLVSYSLLA